MSYPTYHGAKCGERKPLVLLHGAIKTPPFSTAGRVEAGTLLRRLQEGETLSLPLSRPMPSIGTRCHELRVRDRGHNWRIIYRVDGDAILVAEIFAKKTQQTPPRIIAKCKQLLQKYDETRANQGCPQGVNTMDRKTRDHLTAAGFRICDAEDFLGLSDEERQLVELRLQVGKAVRRRRQEGSLSQKQLAIKLQSSQSRVAKIEAAAADVSLDLSFRALFAAGGGLADLFVPRRKKKGMDAGRASESVLSPQ